MITVREVTWGEANGWHPHRHLAAITRDPLDAGERAYLEDAFWLAWSQALVKEGLSAERGPGVLVKPCTSAGGLGAYLAKVDGAAAAVELARSDLKQGRRDHRTPEQLRRDFCQWGDLSDLELFVEYARATKGRQMMTLAAGLRAEYLGSEEEPTDEAIAAAERGGEVLAVLGTQTWELVRAEASGPVSLLEAAEIRGRLGVVEFLSEIAPAGDWWINPPEGECTDGE
jgi:hypothetical protein